MAFGEQEKRSAYAIMMSLHKHFDDYLGKATEIIQAVSKDALSKAGINPDLYSGARKGRILDIKFDGLYVDRIRFSWWKSC